MKDTYGRLSTSIIPQESVRQRCSTTESFAFSPRTSTGAQAKRVSITHSSDSRKQRSPIKSIPSPCPQYTRRGFEQELPTRAYAAKSSPGAFKSFGSGSGEGYRAEGETLDLIPTSSSTRISFMATAVAFGYRRCPLIYRQPRSRAQ